jgi:hypothetical protein
MAHVEPLLRRTEPRHPDAATFPGLGRLDVVDRRVRVPNSMPVVTMPASSGFDGPAASSPGSNRTRLRYGTRPVPGTAPDLLPEALAAGRPHRRITCSRR